MTTPAQQSETDVAIVGMAGRFPGAPDVDALWARVAAGEDCLTDLDADRLVAAGVPIDRVRDPAYVRRAGMLSDVAGFDPGFFGIGERDAAIMDPQHRHFLECAWAALESAGHVPERFPGAVGVFGGSGVNTYLINNLLTDPSLLERLGWFLLRHTGNDKDFLTNNVAYRLDLRGPVVNVQTACSTSLVAVHLAIQSLMSFECDLALAGGATIEFPHGQGYQYREGEILAADGRCRAFDAESSGTVLTSGVGIVALRRLADALADGDPILAVIKGSAINNDGARKVSFFAPSVDGHADVVREGLTVANLSARDIQLIEAHGTGTPVGDPIEVAALTEAFRSFTADRGFCRITSTKPNIGHLDTAAGVASLIKVVQALRHKTLPPLANYTGPSPLLDLAGSPFTLSGEAAAWPGDAPRRAGVSSLGVGGTNAHVVLEEAPVVAPPPRGAAEQALALSGRSEAAVADAARRLADHLERHPDVDLADVSHTLAVGRRAMRHRLVLTARDAEHAVALLRAPDPHRLARGDAGDGERAPGLGFMFPGGGSQYPGMGAGLDARFAEFHALRRRGVELVRALGGPDLAPLLSPGADPAALRRPTASLPAVFLTSVALARQWMAFGAQPTVLIGHSLGEYAAAHLAGVFSFEDALSLVVTRSKLMEQVSGTAAAMLVVALPEAKVRELLPASMSIAAVNADDECVVAGTADDVHRFAALVAELDAAGPLLPLDAAAHCAILDPVLPEFLAAVQKVRLQPPTLPYPSNLTGTWVTPAQATDPQYWVDHLRGTVRFADCLRTALDVGPTVLTELGPGQSLSSYARRMRPAPLAAVPALRHPNHDIEDTTFTVQAFARQWAAGAPVELDPLAGAGRRRLTLPTYPFQHQEYWIAPVAKQLAAPAPAAAEIVPHPVRIDDLDAACWLPTWRPIDDVAAATTTEQPTGRWMIVADDDDDFAAALAGELARRGASVDRHVPGAGAAGQLNDDVAGVVVLAARSDADARDVTRRWFDDLASLAAGASTGTVVAALTRGAMPAGAPALRAADAMALGVTLVAPREYPGLSCRLLDLDPAGDAAAATVVDDLLAGGPPVAAYRDGVRSAPDTVRAAPAATDATKPVQFRQGGAYVVTGGLGGVGHVLATHLATAYRANLVLVASAALPPETDRARWLAEHAYDDETSRRIRRLQSLEALGVKVTVVVADLADAASVRRALDEAERLFGRLHGVIHAAGAMRDRLLAMASPDDISAVVDAKAFGALTLAAELERRGAELLLLVSSTSALLAPPGQAAYVAANAVLDALAGHRGGLRVATMNFGLWADVGMASDAGRRARLGLSDGEPVTHPVFGERHRKTDGATELTGRLDTRHHWVVDDHRTLEGDAVLPGTGHLELMLAAADLAGCGPVDLVGVLLLAPLTVPDGRTVTVRATVTASTPRVVRVESDCGADGSWSTHSEATLDEAGVVSTADAAGDAAFLLEASASLSDQSATIDPLAAPRRGLRLGSRWDAVQMATVHGDQGVARLALEGELAAEASAWRAHPGLVDVATALGVTLAAESHGALYVPIGYGRVHVASPLPPAFTVRAVRDAASTDKLLRIDLLGVDGAGRRVLAVQGLELVPVAAEQHFGAAGADAGVQPNPGPRRVGGTTNLVEVADQLGLRPEEGVALVERLLASAADRLIGSTIDLDELRRALDLEQAPLTPSAAAAPPPAADAASNTVEGAIGLMWSELLGVNDIDPEADYFDHGRHSLNAVRLMARIRRELGARLQLAELFDAPTINTLAARLRAARPELDSELAGGASASALSESASTSAEAPASTMTRHLVAISRTGDKPPLYVVHGGGGNMLFLASLARAMPERPIFGFQAHGIQAGDTPDPSIAAMADRYVAELVAHGPGPYLLGGFSGGGVVALEMANRLRALGEQVDNVVLFDSAPPGKAWPPPLVQNLNLARHLLRKGVGPLKPYLRFRLRPALLFFPGLIKPYLPAGAVTRLQRLVPKWAQWRTDLDGVGRMLGFGEFVAGFVALDDHFAAVSAQHRMGAYAVDTVLIKADLVWPTQPEDYHWRQYVTGRLEVGTTPGDHSSMFYPENASRLAEVLSTLLNAGVGL